MHNPVTGIRDHKTIVHDPKLDRPITAYYNGLDRSPVGSRYELQQGESGKFYVCGNLELAITELARYGKDHYDYNTFQTPIQVTVYAQQSY
jgi:hypothetical protein